MAHWLIGCDPSNGVHDYVAFKQKANGEFTQKRYEVSLPAVRSRASVGEMGLGIKSTDFDYWRWYDLIYTVGDTALEHGVGNVNLVNGRTRYGEESQLFLMAVAFHQLGVKDGDTLDICVLAPPGDATSDMADAYRGGIAKFENELTIAFRDESPSTFHINSVQVYLETVAAGFAAQHNDEGEFLRSDTPMGGAVMIVDGGRVTLDRLVFRGSAVDKTTIEGATNERLGIGTAILRPVAQRIERDLPRVYHNGAEGLVDRALRNPCEASDGVKYYVLTRMGEVPTRAASNIILQAIRQYESQVRAYIETELRETNAERVMLVGGIEPLIGDRLRDALAGRVTFIDLNAYAHLGNNGAKNGVSPTQMNAVGAARLLRKLHKKNA